MDGVKRGKEKGISRLSGSSHDSKIWRKGGWKISSTNIISSLECSRPGTLIDQGVRFSGVSASETLVGVEKEIWKGRQTLG